MNSDTSLRKCTTCTFAVNQWEWKQCQNINCPMEYGTLKPGTNMKPPMIPTPAPQPQITFAPTNVFVEFHLRHKDGLPYHLTEQQVDDVQLLDFVDAADEGTPNKPAEIVFRFDHPMDAHPASLIEAQKAVLEVLQKGWDAYCAEAEDEHVETAPIPGAEMGEQIHFIPQEE